MTLSFEQSFRRLEEILEAMNSGRVPLDESLKLFEEANSLITTSLKALSAAESRIEVLLKSRTGETLLDSQGKPQVAPFS